MESINTSIFSSLLQFSTIDRRLKSEWLPGGKSNIKGMQHSNYQLVLTLITLVLVAGLIFYPKVCVVVTFESQN